MQRLDTPSDKNIEKLLERAVKLADSENVNQATLNRVQDAIDKIDEQIDEPSYKLYEAQALLYLSVDDIDSALQYIEDALVLNDNVKDYTKYGKLLAKKYYDLNENQLEEHDENDDYEGPPQEEFEQKVAYKKPTSKPKKQFSGKIEGWLLLYAIRLLLIPAYLVYDLSFYYTANGDYPEDFVRYLIFTGLIEGIILIVSVWMIFFFFKKNKKAKDIKYLEGTQAVFYLLAGFWLYNLTNDYGLVFGDDGFRIFVYAAGAFLWTLYWLKSERVKQTFIN